MNLHDQDNYIIQFGGLFFAVSFSEDIFGIAFTCGYIRPLAQFQVVLQIGSMALAFGYDVNWREEDGN